MLFGSKRAKIAKAVIAEIAPQFTSMERLIGPLPPQIIYDPYLLGYLVCSTEIFTQIAGGGRLSLEDRGFILFEVVKSIFGKNTPTHAAFTTFSEAHQANPDFLRGAKAAEKIISTGAGFPDFAADPEVVAAREECRAGGKIFDSLIPGASENTKVASYLQFRLFNHYIQQRYGRGFGRGNRHA